MSLKPLVSRTLRQSGYLLAGFPLATAAFVVTVTLFMLGVSTAPFFIGLPILVFALTTASGFAATERQAVTAATGRPMPQPVHLTPAPDASTFRRILVSLSDGQRWGELLWTVVHFIVATFTFCVTVTWWAASAWLVVGPIANPILDRAIPGRGGVFGIPGLPNGFGADLVEYILAAICLLTLPFVIQGLTALQAGVSHAFLSLRSGYEAQISDLRESRSSAHRAEAQSLHRLLLMMSSSICAPVRSSCGMINASFSAFCPKFSDVDGEFVDFDEDPFQVFQFVRRDPFSCQAGCQFFQGAADLEDLGDILQGNIGDIRPAPGNHDDEAFQFQFADGFADRRPADAEFIGQLDFHEPFPRFEYAVLDGLAQGFADDFAQRLISI